MGVVVNKLAGQDGYWNERVKKVKGNYGPGLVLSAEELAFQRKHIRPGGSTLVLGATPSLGTLALDISATVTAVDFAEKVIENAKEIVSHSRRKEIRYVYMDWLKFFEQNIEQYDNIITDGGLLCLDFPGSWKQIVKQIYSHLKPGGVFAAKVYVSAQELPKDTVKNPNLARFMTIPTNEDKNWMVVPTHDDYAKYDVRYALPPKEVVLKTLDSLTVIDELTPVYEEGARFPSFAWQKS